MRTSLSLLALAAFGALPLSASAQQPRPEETEVWTPVPPVVSPGTNGAPPSDAVVLFGGSDLNEWVLMKDKSPATWPVAEGVMTVDKRAGGIETKRSFSSYQLHIEWRIPPGITQTGQSRGNSGIFLASTGSGDMGYEL